MYNSVFTVLFALQPHVLLSTNFLYTFWTKLEYRKTSIFEEWHPNILLCVVTNDAKVIGVKIMGQTSSLSWKSFIKSHLMKFSGGIHVLMEVMLRQDTSNYKHENLKLKKLKRLDKYIS